MTSLLFNQRLFLLQLSQPVLMDAHKLYILYWRALPLGSLVLSLIEKFCLTNYQAQGIFNSTPRGWGFKQWVLLHISKKLVLKCCTRGLDSYMYFQPNHFTLTAVLSQCHYNCKKGRENIILCSTGLCRRNTNTTAEETLKCREKCRSEQGGNKLKNCGIISSQ